MAVAMMPTTFFTILTKVRIVERNVTGADPMPAAPEQLPGYYGLADPVAPTIVRFRTGLNSHAFRCGIGVAPLTAFQRRRAQQGTSAGLACIPVRSLGESERRLIDLR